MAALRGIAIAACVAASTSALAQSRRPPVLRDPGSAASRSTVRSNAGGPEERAGLRPSTITATTPNADGNFGGPGTGGGNGSP